MSTQHSRRAEVSGAGFAGLTVATALAQNGWQVRVHERNETLREEGAGIVLWENSLRVLDELGATPDLMSNSMTPPFYETRFNNEIVSQEDMDGRRWRTQTRPHLFETLLNAARESGVEVRAGSQVKAATADGVLELVSGEKIEADLIVGADGVGSAVRDSLKIPFTRDRAKDGITRFLVPRRKTELQELEPDTNWDNVIDFWNDDSIGLRVLYTPCNDEELYIALMAAASDARGSQVPIDLDVWTQVFPQLAPVLHDAAQTPGKYYRYQTTRLETWTAGRVALIGDAAHAMCPALAQGAGSAISNAYTLAQAVNAEDIPSALASWETLERPYTDQVQDRSQWYADTRSMREGHQFQGESVGMMHYDPTNPERHKEQYA